MRIKDFTDTIRHLTDPFNIPEARRMIQENPALTRQQFAEGQLVQPGPGRQGYQGTKKEIAAIENLKKGKEGRRLHNIVQQEKAWDVIAEAMQQADIHNDMEYLMANEHSTGWRKGYKKGMLKYRDTLNKLQTNPYGVEYVAKKLGEKPDWVLDMVEESKDFAQGERTPIKDTRIKRDFAKAERWLVNNGSRYADPDKFKKAFIKRFGKNNAFISGAGRKPDFSLKFVAEFLSDKPGELSTGTIDNIFKTAIYNLNPTVRDKIVKTLTDFEGMKPMRSRGAVRDWMNSQEILVKFGINEKINGPISRLIQKSIGDEAYKNIQTLRRPYNNTVTMLDYYASKASPKYQKMFTETAEALRAASAGDWKLSASQLKKADKIMYDHKVPSSFIDAGYADEINRAKVVPTSKNFNMEIKMREFDSPMMRLFNKYKNAQPFEKKGILEAINKKKEDFSRKYGRYLDDVSIDVDKKGNLKMSSTAEVVTKKTDLPKSLKTSLAQEKGFKSWRAKVNSAKAQTLAKALELKGIKICQPGKVAEGGRIGFAGKCGTALAADNPNLYMKLAKESKAAMELFKSGQMGKYLRGAKSWTLANMGPAGWIGGELLIMGLGTLYEVSQGKGWKEGLDTWTGLGGHFGMSEKRLKEIGKEQGWSDQQVYDAMKFQKLLALSQEGGEKKAELEGFLEQQDIGGTGRYKSDPGERFIGERGYIRDKYQDPKFLRDLKKEVPEIWKEGGDLYKTLMNPQTSAALFQELQDRKKYEELEKKKKNWEALQKRPFAGQQLEAPDPSDLGPFERSPGHPEYTGAFTKWQPYAAGGIASLKKK